MMLTGAAWRTRIRWVRSLWRQRVHFPRPLPPKVTVIARPDLGLPCIYKRHELSRVAGAVMGQGGDDGADEATRGELGSAVSLGPRDGGDAVDGRVRATGTPESSGTH